jgi:hypothetical protein
MTVFGKILVFLNLLFSIATGALIVFVFTTRSNWVAAYNDAKTKAEAAESRYLAEKASHDNDRKQAEVSLKGETSEKEQLAGELQKAQDQITRLQKVADTQTGITNQSSTELTKLQAELNQIKAERAALVEEKDTARNKVVVIQKELDEQRKIAVNESLQAKNLLQRVTNLLRTVEELTVKTRELEAAAPGGGGGGGSIGTGSSVLDAPAKSAPPGVRGRITAIGKDGTSLAQVNIGSDSGLSPGNSLIVYRGNEYLGDLMINRTEAKAAVGKFIPKSRSAKVQEGDSVITSFTGAPQ